MTDKKFYSVLWHKSRKRIWLFHPILYCLDGVMLSV